MCGIIGYIGSKHVVPILIDGASGDEGLVVDQGVVDDLDGPVPRLAVDGASAARGGWLRIVGHLPSVTADVRSG